MIARAHFILYVSDQRESARFWTKVLDRAPTLDVPGMTELPLGDDAVLGLMPERGIERLLSGKIAPSSSTVPRAELYLVVDDPEAFHARAIDAGGRELSPMLARDWGHRASYVLDPDGHDVAFAAPLQ